MLVVELLEAVLDDDALEEVLVKLAEQVSTISVEVTVLY